MARNRSQQQEKSDPMERQQRWLLLPVLLLLLLGVAASAYLLHLDFAVHSPEGPPGDTFCAISARVNCVTVAASSYSTFLGLPVALYGLEYFALALIAVVLSATKLWGLRRWDSLLFCASLLALPAIATLAWISAFRIHSICIVCMAVYGTVLLLLLLLGIAGRKAFGALVVDGPRELLRNLGRPRLGVGVIVVSLAALSQFFWAPRLLPGTGRAPSGPSPWLNLPTSGLTIGPAGAPLRIEEFTDFQCPHCNHAHEVMIEVLRRFPGKVHLVHRDFPLDVACNAAVKQPFHINACRAAYYARCASYQNKYWPLEAMLFANREQLDEESLRGFARDVGLDLDQLASCVRGQRAQQAIIDDINEGLRRRMTGTPTFFVNGHKVVGPHPIEFWERKIASAGQ